MQMTVTATDKITHYSGVKCRVWEGKTAAGTPCLLFVHAIAVADKENHDEFEKELETQMPPGTVVSIRQVM